jgi:hypothetical protein
MIFAIKKVTVLAIDDAIDAIDAICGQFYKVIYKRQSQTDRQIQFLKFESIGKDVGLALL